MKTSLLRAARRGFTLIEVMVATAIMLVIVLAVVTIAADTFKAYDRAVADLTTQSEARGALDALENDFQTAVIRPDGRCWMEVILPGATTPAGVPKAVGNLQPVDHPIVMLFSAPPDRPRWSPVATNPRTAFKGDVCAVSYRIGQRSPFDAPGDPIQQVYGIYRTIIDPEATFRDALPIIFSSTPTTPTSPWNYWNGARLVPNYSVSATSGGFQTRNLIDQGLVQTGGATSNYCWTLDDQNFIASNVVSMHLTFWCTSSLPASSTVTGALVDPLKRPAEMLRPIVVGSADAYKFGPATYGGYLGEYVTGTSGATTNAAPLRYGPPSGASTLPVSGVTTTHPFDVYGARLRIFSDRVYPDSLGPNNAATATSLPYLPYSVKAVEVSLTILTPEGSKELRALQKLTAAQSAQGLKIPSDNDYKRIVNQYGRNYTRYIKLMANGG
jgi:prepilin-type N-terminal cleavage/methylation domain-containing protein